MKTYMTKQGDTWDLIAFKMLGSENKMTNLLEANPELVNVGIFSADVEINIPEITVETISADPPWRVS